MWNWKWVHGSGFSRAREQWAPTLVAKDPTPPIPLAGDGAAAEGRATVAAALAAADHQPALAFDAAADALQLTGGTFPRNNSEYTQTIWVRRKAGTQDPSFIIENDAAGSTLALALNANVPGLLNGSGFIWNVTIGAALEQDVWYFLAMRVNGLVGTISRGGETVPATHASGAIVAQAAAFRLWFGGTTGAFFPTADLAMVRGWNRVLSDAEIEAERQSAVPVSREGLFGDWRLRSAVDKFANLAGSQHLSAPGVGPWSTTDGPVLGRDTAITAAISSSATVAADLTTSPASGLAATIAGSAAVSAALTTAITLAATPAGAAAVSAALTTSITLAAAPSSSATVVAALVNGPRFAAAPAATGTVTAALTTSIRLAAAATGTGSSTAALTTAITLSLAPVGVGSFSFDLTTSGGAAALQASISGAATVAAALTTAIRLAAAPAGSATVTAALVNGPRFASAISSSATLAAALSTSIRLGSSSSGSASVSVALSTAITAAADFASSASVSADLTTALRFAADFAGVATVVAGLEVGPAPPKPVVYAGESGYRLELVNVSRGVDQLELDVNRAGPLELIP